MEIEATAIIKMESRKRTAKQAELGASENGSIEALLGVLSGPNKLTPESLLKTLHSSLWSSQPDEVKEELARIILADPRLEGHGFEQMRLVNLVAYNDLFDLLHEILKDARLGPNADLSGPLSSAASRGALEIVKILLADGRSNPGSCNALFLASAHGHIDVVKVLLEDSRVNIAIQGLAALHAAETGNQLKIIKFLARIPQIDLNKYDVRLPNTPAGHLMTMAKRFHGGKTVNPEDLLELNDRYLDSLGILFEGVTEVSQMILHEQLRRANVPEEI